MQNSTEIFKVMNGGAQAMCEKYQLDLLGTLPLEPAISAICEEGKSLSRERPDAHSTKVLKQAADSTPR